MQPNASISHSLRAITQTPLQAKNHYPRTRIHTNPRQDQNLAKTSQESNTTPFKPQNKLKLLHLASDSYRGGAESVFRNTIEQTLTLTNYEIFVASCDTLETLPKGIDSSHFLALDDWSDYSKPIGAFKYIFNVKNYKILKDFLFKVRPDVIHTQNYLSRLSPSVLFALRTYKARFQQTRLVFTQHNFGPCPNGGLYNYSKKAICEDCISKSKLRIMWKNCDRRGRIYSILKAIRSLFNRGIFMDEKDVFDRILCVGEFQRQKHIQDGFNPKKTQILQNPIEMKFYNPDVKLEDKQDLIVFFGRLSPEKNVSLLIKAFAKLIQDPKFASYQLCIIGDGDDRVHCENLAHSLMSNTQNISHYKFLGKLAPLEIAEILKNAKLSVMPSLWYETFGLVILESIIAGVVPITSNLGALKETVKQFCGYTFKFDEKILPLDDKNISNLKIVIASTLQSYDDIWHTFIAKRDEILKNINNGDYLKKLIKVYNASNGGGVVIIDLLLILALLYRKYLIIFLDSQSPANIKHILKYTKFCIMPTKCYETFGLTIAESTLGGAIPLASGIGAYKDTIEQFCGYTFDFAYNEDKKGALWQENVFDKNVENLTSRLIELLDNYPRIWQQFEPKRNLIIQNLLHQNYLQKLTGIYSNKDLES